MVYHPDKIVFRKSLSFRLKKEHFEALDELLERHRDQYDSWSHIVRCAIIHLLNYEREQEEKQNARNKKSKHFGKGQNLFRGTKNS